MELRIWWPIFFNSLSPSTPRAVSRRLYVIAARDTEWLIGSSF